MDAVNAGGFLHRIMVLCASKESKQYGVGGRCNKGKEDKDFVIFVVLVLSDYS